MQPKYSVTTEKLLTKELHAAAIYKQHTPTSYFRGVPQAHKLYLHDFMCGLVTGLYETTLSFTEPIRPVTRI